jgi:hypothetical protein
MKCLNKELLIRYHDNELPADVMSEVETHLRTCSHCQLLFARIREDVALVKEALAELNPESPTTRAFDFDQASRPLPARTEALKTVRLLTRGRLLRLAGAIAAIIVVVGILHIMNNGEPVRLADGEMRHSQILIEGNPNEFWHGRQLVVLIIHEDENSEEKIVTSKEEKISTRESYTFP